MNTLNASFGAGKTTPMIIELTRGKSAISYKIHRHWQHEIWYRLNKKSARWKWLKTCKTLEDARRELSRLKEEGDE